MPPAMATTAARSAFRSSSSAGLPGTPTSPSAGAISLPTQARYMFSRAARRELAGGAKQRPQRLHDRGGAFAAESGSEIHERADVVASGADERHLVRQHGHALGRRQGFDLLGHRADHRRGDGGAIVAACSGVAHHPGRTAVERDLLALLLQHLAAAVAGRRLQADGNLPERRGGAGRRGIAEVAVLREHGAGACRRRT